MKIEINMCQAEMILSFSKVRMFQDREKIEQLKNDDRHGMLNTFIDEYEECKKIVEEIETVLGRR